MCGCILPHSQKARKINGQWVSVSALSRIKASLELTPSCQGQVIDV